MLAGVILPSALIGMRLSVSMRFAERWNPTHRHTPTLAAVIVLSVLCVIVQHNGLLIFIA